MRYRPSQKQLSSLDGVHFVVNSTTFSVSSPRFPSSSFSLGGLQAQAEETGFLSLFICGVDVTWFISYMALWGPEMMDFLCLWDGGTEIGSRFALLLESHVNPGDYHTQLCLVWHSVPISTHVFVLNTGAPLVCWFFSFSLPASFSADFPWLQSWDMCRACYVGSFHPERLVEFGMKMSTAMPLALCCSQLKYVEHIPVMRRSQTMNAVLVKLCLQSAFQGVDLSN